MTGITKFVPGVNTNFSTELNANYASGWSITLKNHIRELIDRAGIYSADKTDLWGEAYISGMGRNESVDISSTTAEYDGTSFAYSSIPVLNQTGTIVNYGFGTGENAFDNDLNTIAGGSGNPGYYIGRDFGSSKYIGQVSIKVGRPSDSWAYKLQSYNGSTWSDIAGTSRVVSESGVVQKYVINASHNGIRLYQTDYYDSGVYDMTIETTLGAETLVYLDIPNNIFTSTVSLSVGSFIAENFADGSDVQYKLTNTSDDSGWLNTGEVSTFTAFADYPTTAIVKIISPTDYDTSQFSNSGFESALSGSDWVISGNSGELSASRSTTYAQTGSYSLKINSTGTTVTNEYLDITQTIDASGCDNIRLAFYRTAYVLRYIELVLFINGVEIENLGYPWFGGTTPLSTWGELTFIIPKKYRNPDTEITLRMFVASGSPSYPGDVYFDNIITKPKTSIIGFAVKAE